MTQDLKRNAASALQILGFIDRAHAARAERPDDSIMAELLPRLRQAAEVRPRPRQRYRSPGTRDRLGLHGEFEEAFGTQIGRCIAGKLGAAPHALALRRRCILRLIHIVPLYD